METLKSLLNSSPQKIIVIGGAAKAGTTLPLTLLDGHSQLLTFPEELRYFEKKIDQGENESALEILLSDQHIQMLASINREFSENDYVEHGGTGFGRRDYSLYDYEIFVNTLKYAFPKSKTKRQRFNVIMNAFRLSCGVESWDNIGFVCKAPHNEFYANAWNDMLGTQGRYLIAVRQPTEHFLSLNNVNALARKLHIDATEYVRIMRKRARFWKRISAPQRLFIDYDTIAAGDVELIKNIAKFCEIEWSETLLHPTKGSVPWSGNSSRGIISSEIFENPHSAQYELSEKEITTIEYGLWKLYDYFGYRRIYSHPVGYRKRALVEVQLLHCNLLRGLKKIRALKRH